MTFKEIYRQDKTRGIIGILSIPAGIFMLATGILSDFSTEGKIFALTGYASLSILGYPFDPQRHHDHGQHCQKGRRKETALIFRQ